MTSFEKLSVNLFDQIIYDRYSYWIRSNFWTQLSTVKFYKNIFLPNPLKPLDTVMHCEILLINILTEPDQTSGDRSTIIHRGCQSHGTWPLLVYKRLDHEPLWRAAYPVRSFHDCVIWNNIIYEYMHLCFILILISVPTLKCCFLICKYCSK